ncbi:MAG: ribosome silencing factor [Pseudomonadota bacterium]
MLSFPHAGAGANRRISKEDKILSPHAGAAAISASERAGRTAVRTVSSDSSGDLLEDILASLSNDKAEEIVTIDLNGKSSVADHMVVCSGRSNRQVVAISENLVNRLKRTRGVVTKIEGKDAGDWVLIDAGDVIVHVFRPEVREFYQLEKMWQSPGTPDI